MRRFWNGNYARYVEPFAGSACLFFAIGPERAVLGDNNAELINVYCVLRDAPERVHRRLVRISRDRDTYYRWRSKDPQLLDAETRAVRFVYLNHNCFNGIYRTNLSGQFNVPFGSKLASYLTRDEFIDRSASLKNVQFIAADFQDTLSQVMPGDFVYLDPPYAVTSRRLFRQYGQKPFDTDDVDRLAGELNRIHRLGAHFVVSYADCRQARQLTKSWHSQKVQVRRHIAGFTDHRTYSYEWIIYNGTSL